MTVLDRYLLKEFGKILSLTLISLISLYLLFDIFEKIDDILEKHVPVSNSIMLFLYKVPHIFYQVSPVAVLMATILTMSIFSKHQEITAVKSGGISIFRFASPLLIAGFMISAVNLAINETITPFMDRTASSIERDWLKSGSPDDMRQEDMWHRDNDSIYSVRFADTSKNTVNDFIMFKLDEAFHPLKMIYADKVIYNEGRWIIKSGVIRRFKSGENSGRKIIKDVPLTMLGGPEDIKQEENNAVSMDFATLSKYIGRLKKEGYGISRYLVDLHNKIAFPFANLIMVLVGIPLAASSGRKGGLALSIVATILIGFSYWVISSINISLGHNGSIPAVFAAWFTNIIFCSIGLLMFSHVRQ